MMIRCHSKIDDWCFGCGLLVTWCSCSLFCVTQSTVGWSGGLDHKAGDLCGWLLIVDGFGWRLV